MSPGGQRVGTLMTTLDFGPTTSRLAEIVRGVRDDQLDDPTPNAGRSVGDLLDHIGGLAAGLHRRRPEERAARRHQPHGRRPTRCPTTGGR